MLGFRRPYLSGMPKSPASLEIGRAPNVVPMVSSHRQGCDADQSAVQRRQDQAGGSRRLNRAFTFTLRSLGFVERDNDPVCEIIARKVIEIDAAGTHDPEEIATLAVKQLGIP